MPTTGLRMEFIRFCPTEGVGAKPTRCLNRILRLPDASEYRITFGIQMVSLTARTLRNGNKRSPFRVRLCFNPLLHHTRALYCEALQEAGRFCQASKRRFSKDSPHA